MKVRNTLASGLVLCAMAAVLALLAAGTGGRADAQQQQAVKVFQEAGYGLTTGLLGIVEGQTARLAVWNKGDEAVLTRLQLVDEQGKVLVLRDAIIQPGKTATADWPCCGGNVEGGPHRVELQAQVGTVEKRSIGLLVPTVQIIDGTSNATLWMIGPEGFVETRIPVGP